MQEKLLEKVVTTLLLQENVSLAKFEKRWNIDSSPQNFKGIVLKYIF